MCGDPASYTGASLIGLMFPMSATDITVLQLIGASTLLGDVDGEPETDEPTAEEIAAQLDMEPARVRELIQLAQDPISLETPVGEEEDAHLEDFIRDDEAGVPADEAGRQLLRRELMNVLKSLTPREERVIALRFGLEDGRARTLEELGREFNVTRERVRQIEAKALRKLRHPSRAKRLRDYLDE